MCMSKGGSAASSAASTPKITQSAPGSTAVATIDTATEEQRTALKDRLAQAKGRSYTNVTGGTGVTTGVDSLGKKTLIGQ